MHIFIVGFIILIMFAICFCVAQTYLFILSKVKPNHCENINDVKIASRIGAVVAVILLYIPLFIAGSYIFKYWKMFFIDTGFLTF